MFAGWAIKWPSYGAREIDHSFELIGMRAERARNGFIGQPRPVNFCFRRRGTHTQEYAAIVTVL